MDASHRNRPTLAFVGFGEAARAFARGLSAASVVDLVTYDIKLAADEQRMEIELAGAELGVTPRNSLADALAGAVAVFSLVTADQAEVAARQVAESVEPATLYFDCNSCSPGTKKRSAEALSSRGVHYIDVAVMAPVHPKLHRTPLLISGPNAEEAAARFAELGMDASIVGDKVGEASAIKMVRSIMIKGLEALTAECFLAARRLGVEDRLTASLQASDPGMDWRARAAYNFERAMVHGKRRAAEMREVVAMLREIGLPDRMASATAEWQGQVGALALPPGPADLAARADLILAALDL